MIMMRVILWQIASVIKYISFSSDYHLNSVISEVFFITVRLDKMAQHERLWALFMAQLKAQSQNASNMALGQYIGLQHI